MGNKVNELLNSANGWSVRGARDTDHRPTRKRSRKRSCSLEIGEAEHEERLEAEYPKLLAEEEADDNSPRRRAWTHEDRAKDIASIRVEVEPQHRGARFECCRPGPRTRIAATE